jgi:hypothetical protein
VPALMDVRSVRSMLATTQDVTEVKDIRDRAEALRQYARTQKKKLGAQNDAAEAKLWCERRLGELLRQTQLHRGAATRSHDATALGVKLAELGIRRWESHRYQQVATIPEVLMRRYIQETRDAHREITTAGLVRFAHHHAARVGEESPLAGPAGNAGGKPWTLDEAVKALTRAVVHIACRWPAGQEDMLATTLRDLAHDLG